MWGLLLLLPLLLGWTPNHNGENGKMPSQQVEDVDGGSGRDSGERCVWHLIFLTMKDDIALADANFSSDGEKCFIGPNLKLCICTRLPSSWKPDESFNPPRVVISPKTLRCIWVTFKFSIISTKPLCWLWLRPLPEVKESERMQLRTAGTAVSHGAMRWRQRQRCESVLPPPDHWSVPRSLADAEACGVWFTGIRNPPVLWTTFKGERDTWVKNSQPVLFAGRFYMNS